MTRKVARSDVVKLKQPNRSKYYRRFTKDEFAEELFTHLNATPDDYTDQQLREHTQRKAKHYAEAIDSLDAVTRELKDLAKRYGDKESQEKLNFAIDKIDASIKSYGEASLIFNHAFTYSVINPQ